MSLYLRYIHYYVGSCWNFTDLAEVALGLLCGLEAPFIMSLFFCS